MARKRAGKRRRTPSSVGATRGRGKARPASGGAIRAVYRFLGSLKLAVPLLVLLAAVLAGATLLESAKGSEFAQWYVYYSRWFIVLLSLLAVNILVATVIRWPWKMRYTGFLLTHLGLLVLLAGSIQSFVAGIDGQLTFAEGETADTIVISDRSQLTMSWRENGSSKELVFAFAPGPTDWPAEKPLDFGSSGDVGVKVLRFFRHARREVGWVEDPSGRSAPAIQFALVGSRGTQVAEQWIAASKFGGVAALGPATFALYEVPIRPMLDDLLHPPTDELGAAGLLSVYYQGQVRQVSVDENIGQRIAIGRDGTEVELAAYLPDAKPGADGKFSSAGDDPHNPMLELRVHLPDEKEPLRQIAFARVPFLNLDGAHRRACPVKFLYHHPAVSAQTGAEFLQTPDGKLYCRVGWDGRYQSRGEVNEGDEIEAFASFRIRLLRHVRHATREVTFQPAEFTPGDAQAPEAAALFEVAVGGETERVWLQRGSPEHGFQRIQTPNGPMDLTFGYSQRPLGFSLRLVEFTRGRNPGGMGDASYASRVELEDKSLTQQHEISMNEPLTYGKFTFYQSAFDRMADGREISHLSVAYDPGRLLKYSGCLMMCVGTFVMFYWKGRPSKKARSATGGEPSSGPRPGRLSSLARSESF